MEGETDAEVEHHPGQVEEGQQALARQEGLELVQVPQRLQAVPAGAVGGHARHQVVDPAAQVGVQRGADLHQDAGAQEVQRPLEHVDHQDQHHEADQGLVAAAGQHVVIDQQHEERAGQHQHIEHAADGAHADEGAAEGRQGLVQFGALL